MPGPKRAFIFDMDGTIVDNMAFHTRSWLAFFQRRGHAIDEAAFFLGSAGRQGREIIRTHLGEGLSDADSALLLAEKESAFRSPACLQAAKPNLSFNYLRQNQS